MERDDGRKVGGHKAQKRWRLGDGELNCTSKNQGGTITRSHRDCREDNRSAISYSA
jgi:hypothetical protein